MGGGDEPPRQPGNVKACLVVCIFHAWHSRGKDELSFERHRVGWHTHELVSRVCGHRC